MLDSVVAALEKTRYEFSSPEDFNDLLLKDVRLGMRTYWREILSRCHWSASLSLVRSHRWMSGIIVSYNEKNLMLFSASLRGFIESSADVHDALFGVAPHLAKNQASIMRAVHGNMSELHLDKELEDRLIHFTHARKPEKANSYLMNIEQKQ